MTTKFTPELEFKGDIKQLNRAVDRLNNKLEDFGRKGKAQAKKVNKAFNRLKIGIVAIGVIASIAFKRAISVAEDFEQAMANLRAIARPTREEFQALEKDALELGRTTKFTASQVAGLQTEYAKLGFSAEEILKVTKGTLALATATGADLAESASIAGATLRGFGLDASQTGRVTDVMAESFSKSALDMRKFADSMKFVAPVAKQAGFSIEGTTALLGQLANAGIDGSLAGTALRTIFLKLADSGSALSKRIGPGVDTIEKLVPALAKMKREGIDVTEMLKLVDKRSVSAFGILVDGADAVLRLKDGFDQAGGSAQKMADEQMDTLKGDMFALTSATEGLAIAFIDHFMVAIRGTVKAITGLVSTITKFMEIPVSRKLREEQQEFNALFGILQDVNTEQDTRNKAIEKLQEDYPDYIKNIDLEKASLDDLAKAQAESNKQFIRKIQLASAEQILQKEFEKTLSIQNKLFKAELELQRLQGMADESRVGVTIGLNRAMIAQELLVDKLKGKLDKSTEAYKFLEKALNDLIIELGIVSESADEAGEALNKPGTEDPLGVKKTTLDLKLLRLEIERIPDDLEVVQTEFQLLNEASQIFETLFDPAVKSGDKLKSIILSALSAFQQVILASQAVNIAVSSIFKGGIGLPFIIASLAGLELAKAGVKSIKFAKGGIINQPVFSPLLGGAIAGERGREAIIPLDRGGGVFDVMNLELRGIRKDLKKLKGVQIESNINGVEFVESHIEPAEREIEAIQWP